MGEGARAAAVALGLCVASCGIAKSEAPTQSTSGGASSSSGSSDESPISYPPVPDDGAQPETADPDTGGWGGTAGSATTANPATAGSGMMTTAPPSPTDPECSVQEVTEGELMSPVDKANEVGRIPVSVGNMLENYCGCHTLMSNNQNLKFEFLKAPGGTLFLDYDDLSRSFDGGTLGEAMAEQTLGNTMPPGSCSFPGEPAAILDKWFTEGTPDGATFEEP